MKNNGIVFNELIISKLLLKINELNPIEEIMLSREFVDNINKPRKEYFLKFKDEDEKCFMWLSDVPFRVDEQESEYDVIYETLYGKVHLHDKREINSVVLKNI